jgi:hypothetical protein
VPEHLRLVTAHGVEQGHSLRRDTDQCLPQQLGVAQSRVGPLAAPGRHGVHGVAEKGDVGRGPGRDRSRAAQADGEGGRDVGLIEDPPGMSVRRAPGESLATASGTGSLVLQVTTDIAAPPGAIRRLKLSTRIAGTQSSMPGVMGVRP